jgi:hypothetical protein
MVEIIDTMSKTYQIIKILNKDEVSQRNGKDTAPITYGLLILDEGKQQILLFESVFWLRQIL